MPLKQVSSFQTSDNQLFHSRSEALDHQFEIDCRAFFNRSNSLNRLDAYTSKHVAEVIQKNLQGFMDLTRKYNEAKARLARAAKKIAIPIS